MRQSLDLDRFPIDCLESDRGRSFVSACRSALAADGMVDLPGLVRPAALRDSVAEIAPLFPASAFRHKRAHNVYFDDDIAGLAPDHPALRRLETANHTVCADQIPHNLVCRLYAWPPFAAFLAAVLEKPRLYTMDDPLACVNVMSYGAGDALNWHFDRSEFTTTLLLQAPLEGGLFQYRPGLRSPGNPNYAGVQRLLKDKDDEVKSRPTAAGTLSLFKGRDTAHRITPVEGGRNRIVTVFSFYEKPGVRFSAAERRGFYGRASAEESLA